MRKTRQRILGMVLAVVMGITLLPTGALAAADRPYAFHVHTADEGNAGTDATIRVGFYFHEFGRAEPHTFEGWEGNKFEQNAWDWCNFRDATSDPWMARQIYVGTDGSGIAPGWTPSEVEIYMPYVAGSSGTRRVGQVVYSGIDVEQQDETLDCSNLTKRNISNLGGFENWKDIKYINSSTSGTLKKTWDCQMNDDYCYNSATYNPWTMSDPPTLTVTPSNSAINCYTFDENGEDGQVSFELDYKTLYDQMYEAEIGQVTFNFSTIFPARTTNNNTHTKSLTVYRTCFELGNESIAQSPTYSPMRDNFFFNKEMTDVTITMEPASIHLMPPTSAQKIELAENFLCTPELYVNKENGEKLCDMTYSKANGVITFKGTIPQNTTSEQYGVRLQLNNVSSAYNGMRYSLNKGISKSIMFTTHKVDTISPKVSMVDKDSKPLSIANTIKQIQQLYMIGSEALYHSKADAHGADDQNLFRYSLFKYNAAANEYSNVASQITNFDGHGSVSEVRAPINTAVLKDIPINLKLAQKEEGKYKLRVYACDFANNGLGDAAEYKDYENIYVDNLAPRVNLSKIVQNQVPDGTKRIDCEFNMEDLAINSGVPGSWARTYYCFVPIGDAMPEPDMAHVESGELGSTMNKWAFIEGGATSSTAIFKVAQNQTFEGKLYYFTLDSAGNSSRAEVKKVFEEPIHMANYDTKDTLVTTIPSYPQHSYEIAFKDEENITTQYHWVAKDLGSNFRQSYIQYEAGAAVGAGTQTTDDGKAVLMDGNFTLEYKVTEGRSGNYKVFTKDYSFDNAAPQVTLKWVKPNLSASTSQQANVRIVDMSGITVALYRIVNPDGSPIKDYADTELTLVANAENIIEVKDTITFSLDKSGVYGLCISARDKNDYSDVVQPKENGLFVLRKQKSKITAFGHSLTNKVGGIGVTNKDYSLNVSVTDQMLNAKSLTKAQVVKYCISTDGSNYGPWTTADGTMTVGANELTHSFVLKNPTVLTEGDNTIYIKTVCTDEGDDAEPAATLISDPKVLTIKLDSSAPTYDEIRYSSTSPTVENVIGTLRTSDFGTGVTKITCEDKNVEISGGEDGFYTFTIKGDVETSATLTDLVGNTVLVPIKVTNIDKEAPVITSTVEEVLSGERQDAKITVNITEKSLNEVKFALLSDGSSTLDDAAYEKFQKASTFETTKTTNGDETVYTIFARGMTGTFSLGVKATDGVGQVTEAVLKDPFTTTDVAAAIKSVSCDAMKTKSKTTVTVTFNTKVAVQEVESAVNALDSAERETLNKNAPLSDYSLTYDILRSDANDFALKVRDECGRVSTLLVSPTAEFYTGNKIKTTLTKNGYLMKEEGKISFSGNDEICLVITPDAEHTGKQSFFMDKTSVLSGFVWNEAASVKSTTDEAAYTKLSFNAAHDNKTIKSVSFSSTTGGVVESEYVAVSIIDETAPTYSVEYDVTKATSGDVTATVKLKDLETGITKVEEKQADGSFIALETKPILTVVFAENGVKTYRVTNGANMVTEFNLTVANIDKNPIVEGADYTVKYRHRNYLGEWVPVKDGNSYNSVLAVIEPTANNGKTLSIRNNNGMSKILTHEENTFTFQIADTSDHMVEQVVSYNHFDNEASTITWSLSNTEKTNKNITATVTITDKQNEIAFAQIKNKEGVVYPWKDKAIAGEYSADLDASGIYTVTAYDEAGNSSTENIVVSNLDKVVPKISSLVYTIPQGTITARDVRVDIKAFSKENVKMLGIELGQGLKETDVLYTPGSQSIRFKKNGYVSAFFVDDYGNVGADVISVSNIYSKPPQLKAVTTLAADQLSASVRFEKEVDKSGMPLDPFRDLSELYVVYGGITYKASEAVFTLKNNSEYSFLIFDASGSSQQIQVKVSGIDDVAPKITKVGWSYDYLEQNSESVWESKTAQKTLVIGTDTSGAEAGYVVGDDQYHVTNGNVTVTVTTDKDTSPVGTTNKPSKEASIIYQENGLYIFNQQAANGTSDSYGVDVEVIDKVAPHIELKNGPELIFIEGNKDPNYAYDKKKLIDYVAYDVKKSVKTDLTSKVTIDYGTFDPENIANNTFDRSSPYYITYTVRDAAGNKTVVQRTIRLVGFYDTIALINGVMPDSTSTATAVGSAMEITLKNFSGVSYARYEKGIYTMGQMKAIGKTLVERKGAYTITGATEGWYTIYIQTDKRDYFNISVYYKPNAK